MTNLCDRSHSCNAAEHGVECWRGWLDHHGLGAERPQPEPRYFTIHAEYLHLYVGRRVALSGGPGGRIPFVVDAVTLRPETGLIEVAAFILPNIVGVTVGADTLVEVQHAA